MGGPKKSKEIVKLSSKPKNEKRKQEIWKRAYVIIQRESLRYNPNALCLGTLPSYKNISYKNKPTNLQNTNLQKHKPTKT